MSNLDAEFARYFEALDRSGGEDRCFLCRRSPADVKSFFGFDEDGHPTNPQEYGIEDIVFEEGDVMSYRGHRPICSVCQLNFDSIFILDGGKDLEKVLGELRDQRDLLWPDSH